MEGTRSTCFIALATKILKRSNEAIEDEIGIEESKNIIIDLQSFLEQSLDFLARAESEFDEIKNNNESNLRTIRNEIKEIVENRSKTELELLNQIAKLDEEKKLAEDVLRMKLQHQADEMEHLQDEIHALRQKNTSLISPKSVTTNHFDITIQEKHQATSPPKEIYCAKPINEEETSDASTWTIPPEEKKLVEEYQESSFTNESKQKVQHRYQEMISEKEKIINDLQQSNANLKRDISQLMHAIHQNKIELSHSTKLLNERNESLVNTIINEQEKTLNGLEELANIYENVEDSLIFVENLCHKEKNFSSRYLRTRNEARLVLEELKLSLSSIRLQLQQHHNVLQSHYNRMNSKNHSENHTTSCVKDLQQCDNEQTHCIDIHHHFMNLLRSTEDRYTERISNILEQIGDLQQNHDAEISSKSSTIYALVKSLSEFDRKNL